MIFFLVSVISERAGTKNFKRLETTKKRTVASLHAGRMVWGAGPIDSARATNATNFQKRR